MRNTWGNPSGGAMSIIGTANTKTVELVYWILRKLVHRAEEQIRMTEKGSRCQLRIRSLNGKHLTAKLLLEGHKILGFAIRFGEWASAVLKVRCTACECEFGFQSRHDFREVEWDSTLILANLNLGLVLALTFACDCLTPPLSRLLVSAAIRQNISSRITTTWDRDLLLFLWSSFILAGLSLLRPRVCTHRTPTLSWSRDSQLGIYENCIEKTQFASAFG